jgi:putative ATP-dependent endonuclease of OLD family
VKVTRAHIKNFRLLEDADIALDDKATIIVGRNNSGKTSVIEIFRKLARTDSTSYSYDDLSLTQHAKFTKALGAYEKSKNKELRSGDDDDETLETAIADLPEIVITLTINYEATDNLAPLAPFILDLDPGRSDIHIRHRASIADPEALFSAYIEANSKNPQSLDKFLRRTFPKHLITTLDAIDPNDTTNQRPISSADFNRLISVKFIYAQNQIDDLASDGTKGLSKGFESFYKSNAPANTVAADIEALLATAGTNLDAEYKKLFATIFTDLKDFGVGRMRGLPEIRVVSEFEALRLMIDNTKLYYKHNGSDLLPEAHNGLGYSKLIFTILMFIGFYEELKRSSPEPPLQLIFVEEPEAHLHPQMQYVFVKNIRDFIAKKADWNAQTVITTHSSHIVSESGFTGIRYFDNSVQPLAVRDLAKFEVEQKKAKEKRLALDFLKQYMVLNRCDMFFADKVILIEGTVERLVLPEMIKAVSKDLLHQYLSVIEVGGAYAHLFKEILEFLNVQTLIITDIDSVDPGNKKAVPVSSGMVTSNPTLSKWLPAEADIGKLLAKKETHKTAGRVRVAYQIPEKKGARTGRSFEEAFVLANAAMFASHKRFTDESGDPRPKADILRNSWVIAKDLPKKTDFAFEIMQLTNWTTPAYIKEGLTWLAKDL